MRQVFIGPLLLAVMLLAVAVAAYRNWTQTHDVALVVATIIIGGLAAVVVAMIAMVAAMRTRSHR